MEDVALGIGLHIYTQKNSGSIPLPFAKFKPSDLKNLFSISANKGVELGNVPVAAGLL